MTVDAFDFARDDFADDIEVNFEGIHFRIDISDIIHSSASSASGHLEIFSSFEIPIVHAVKFFQTIKYD